MANVRPFRGLIYDPAVVGSISDVVSPPYDVIDVDRQAVLYARHPQNVIRLELGKQNPDDTTSQNRYTRAAAHLEEWIRCGALRRDERPGIYPYTIEYRPPGREAAFHSQKVLRGFLSLMQLEEFGPGRVLPHENTRAAAKADRLNLLEACRANFSPIFSLFSDPQGHAMLPIEKVISSQPPRIEFEDDEGFRQRLWSITDSDLLEELVAAMKSKPLFIADGHHRYETALRFREMQRQRCRSIPSPAGSPWDSVLMLSASLEDPGLTVLPTHRVISIPLPPLAKILDTLKKTFEIEELPFQGGDDRKVRDPFLHALRERGRSAQVFGLALREVPAYLLLILRGEEPKEEGASPRDRLDVSVLHSRILGPLGASELAEDHVEYTKDDDEALDLVQSGSGQAAFLLNPTKVSEVSAVASAGERMPHKSTYFFPKPLTGLVMHAMES